MVSNDEINKKLKNKLTGVKEENKIDGNIRKKRGITKNSMLKGKKIREKSRQPLKTHSTEVKNECPKCKKLNPNIAKFCIKCGQGLGENENKKRCAHCKTINPDTAEFCIKCGHGLGLNENTKICPYCAAKNPSKAEFCQKCGKNINPKTITTTHKKPVEGLSPGEAIVICLFSPIAGAIGFLFWHDNKPEKSKQSCVLAILAFVVGILIYIILRAYIGSFY